MVFFVISGLRHPADIYLARLAAGGGEVDAVTDGGGSLEWLGCVATVSRTRSKVYCIKKAGLR